MNKYPFLIVFACVAFGAAAQSAFGLPAPAVWGAGLVVLAAAAWSRHFLIPFGLALVLFGAALYGASPQAALARAWSGAIGSGGEVTVTGTVADRLSRSENSFGGRRVSFVLANLEAGRKKLPGSLKVYAPDDAALRYGDRLRVTGEIAPPAFRRNPAGYEERAFFRHLGIGGSLHAGRVEKTGFAVGAPGAVYALKNRLLSHLDSIGGGADLSKALFLGERANLDPAFRTALIRTGTMHYFAVSGSNVALVAAFFLLFAALAGAGEKTAALVAIAPLAVFCAMTGSNPPVMRATVMALVVLGGTLLGRRPAALNSLGLAGLGMAIANPEELFDPGFQLSFAAVFGLVVLGRPFHRAFEAARARGALARKALAACFAALAVSVVASAATAPFAAAHFHQIFLLAPIVNVILLPAVTVLNVLLLGYAALFFVPAGWLWPLALSIRWGAHALESTVRAFDAFASFRLPLAGWDAITWTIFLGGLAWLAFSKRLRPAPRLAAIFLFALNASLGADAAAKAAPARESALFFDVGQGDAIFVEFSNGSNLLVDTGGGGGDFAIAPYLRSRGVRRIDAVVVSHPQFDHCGALEALIEEFEIGLVADNGDANPAHFYGGLTRAMRERGIRRETLSAGDRLSGYPDAEIDVLGPGASFASDLNQRSVVLMVQTGGHRMLLTGDIGESGLEAWGGAGSESFDVLKVPHHGARAGDAALELFRQKPRLALIQAGERNRYGHPNPETLDRLEELAGHVYRTDRDGAVRVDLRTLQARTMREQAR